MICFECNHDHDFKERPWCDVSNYEIEHRKLLQENSRLREALEEIACFNDAVELRYLDEHFSAKIARKALKGGE